MSSVPEPRKLLPALALAALLAAGCELADNGTGSATGNTISTDGTGTATNNTFAVDPGTGTSTGNTISSLVLDPDGKPAAAARVILRPMGYVPDSLGISESSGPGSRLDTVTDANGRFTFDKLAAGNYLIECFRDLPKTTLVSWTENILLAKDQIRNLDPLQLDIATGLTGRAGVTDTAGTDNLWVGFPGTERFVRLGPDLHFTLPVFPKDRKAFTLYRKRPAGDWQQITVGGWKFRDTALPPGAPKILVPFTLPGLASQDTAISVADSTSPPDTVPDPARQAGYCPEAGPDTLIENRASTLSPQNLRVRTLIPGLPSPAHVIELDPCKGSWRVLTTAGTMAPPREPHLSFSSPGADYFLLPSLTHYIRYDSLLWTGVDLSFPGVTGVVHHKGKYHVLYGGTEVGIYADTSFLHGGAGAPEDRIPVMGPSSLAGIAYLGEVMYSYVSSSGASGSTAFGQAALFRFDLVSRESRQLVLQGSDSVRTLVGLTKASETALWLLTDDNRLLLWDAATEKTIKTYLIAAPAHVRTLTRKPD